MDFNDLANNIENGPQNFLRVQPDGRTRPMGYTAVRYQNMVETLTFLARAELEAEGYEQETIANIVFPNAERKRTTFTKKIESAIQKAAERERFR